MDGRPVSGWQWLDPGSTEPKQLTAQGMIVILSLLYYLWYLVYGIINNSINL